MSDQAEMQNRYKLLKRVHQMIEIKHQTQKFIIEYQLKHPTDNQTKVGEACVKEFKPIFKQHQTLSRYLSQVIPVLNLTTITDFSRLNNDVLNNYIIRALEPLDDRLFDNVSDINKLATQYRLVQQISSSIQFKIHNADAYKKRLDNDMQMHPALLAQYQIIQQFAPQNASQDEYLNYIVQNCKKIIFIQLSKTIQQKYYDLKNQIIPVNQ